MSSPSKPRITSAAQTHARSTGPGPSQPSSSPRRRSPPRIPTRRPHASWSSTSTASGASPSRQLSADRLTRSSSPSRTRAGSAPTEPAISRRRPRQPRRRALRWPCLRRRARRHVSLDRDRLLVRGGRRRPVRRGRAKCRRPPDDSLTRLFGWLDGALPSLARMARARHEHLSAERMLPPLPSPDDWNDDGAPPLPQAERLFREAYLRQLLSRSGNRTIAARRAGVPYTTFCSMLKKLGLE